MTLTEFLLARITEDEVAAAYGEHDPVRYGADWSDPTRTLGTRVLAECAAKRRIVEFGEGHARWSNLALRALASIYAGHPDYCEEWA